MYCNLDTDNKVVVKEAERTEGPAEKANDVRKPGKEIEKVREIWRSSGVGAEDKNLHKPPIKSRMVYWKQRWRL